MPSSLYKYTLHKHRCEMSILGHERGVEIRLFSLVALHLKVSGRELMFQEWEGRGPILYFHPGAMAMTPFSQHLCPDDLS